MDAASPSNCAGPLSYPEFEAPCGGWVVDFPLGMQLSDALEVLQWMQAAEWIDSGTRGVSLEVVGVTLSSFELVAGRFIVRYSAGGRVLPVAAVSGFRVTDIEPFTFSDGVGIACVIVMVVQTVVLIVQWVRSFVVQAKLGLMVRQHMLTTAAEAKLSAPSQCTVRISNPKAVRVPMTPAARSLAAATPSPTPPSSEAVDEQLMLQLLDGRPLESFPPPSQTVGPLRHTIRVLISHFFSAGQLFEMVLFIALVRWALLWAGQRFLSVVFPLCYASTAFPESLLAGETLWMAEKSMLVIVLIFSFVRVFGLFKLSPSITLLSRTVTHAVVLLGPLICAMLLLFAGFLLAGLTMFGDVDGGYFRTPADGAVTLFMVMIGSVDEVFFESRQVAQWSSFILFGAFYFCMSLIALNMVLAIVLESMGHLRDNEPKKSLLDTLFDVIRPHLPRAFRGDAVRASPTAAMDPPDAPDVPMTSVTRPLAPDDDESD